MDLEHVTAELRPRSAWEAADFGARLIRRDAAAIYRVWFAVTLPLVGLAALAVAYTPYPTLAALAYWWLEPLADGPMLHIVSRRLFGEKPSARAALKALPALAWRNRIFLLSPYRFHFARSIAMPLTQLEGMSGKRRHARAKVLNPRIMRYGTGVTVAYQHLVLSLYVGVILIGFVLVPAQYQETIGVGWVSQFFTGDTRVGALLGLLIGYLAQSALEPWFVGCGFGLYVNCRTELEAWDLEIAFRRMVQRRAGRAAAAVLVAAVVLAPMIALPQSARAQAPEPAQAEMLENPGFPFWGDEAVRPAVDEVMASDALDVTREIERWQRIDRRDANVSEPGAAEGLLTAMLQTLTRALSAVVELALWILIGVLLLAGAVLVVRRRRSLRARVSAPPSAQRVVLAGGEISAETLPGDVPAEVLKLWRAGERRGAMSLLYRGSVFAAVEHLGVRLPPSATEGMCVAAVERQAEAAKAEFFRKVVTAWTWYAYGARDPSDDFVSSICAEWPRHYGTA
ncbi:MAG TPA: hypothetical protein VF329_06330 [Gammaproteobacteria bacterium]